MISRQAKYALEALIALAQLKDGNWANTAEIAQTCGIPRKFCETILLTLKNRGLIKGYRGKGGGYALLKSASEITLAEVLSIIDGPTAPLPCLNIVGPRICKECDTAGTCKIAAVLAPALEPLRRFLIDTTIADIKVELSIDNLDLVDREYSIGQK